MFINFKLFLGIQSVAFKIVVSSSINFLAFGLSFKFHEFYSNGNVETTQVEAKVIQRELTPTVKIYFSRVKNLLTSAPFWFLTIFGNLCTFLLATLVYHFESGLNPKMESLFDVCWWAFATITTIGYGDVVPITVPGRAIGIILMFMGTGFFVTYTALFSNAFLGREIDRLDYKMKRMSKEVSEIEHDEEMMETSIEEIKQMLNKLDQRIKKNKERN
ncbi:MAG: hypothetical protein COW00_01630 [Bdellovibrio sp. CG12_big_fil_rev_8_21_14_0_65_39_13]|nr:MAG: hypothetical protein COW78_03380 [Bdellovibrio sp. CG22_combo_CG10-13_8_21_14_all_39_27]PIQ62410.1 MAG: hypothetical protein COW00_01630 [Bdellovibrio sp. CG12_big_fil_rev_8_21_14_0_65_39_13]PIR34077.1 MAG: hypothetical protein COV37_14110 [Bdellovibrio sp. CG11_big_fil_rev_8_21_14_0_20_39_38]